MPRKNLREPILQAGLELLRERGYHASSVHDITAAAGAPKGSFYNHFESKQALAVEALSAYVAQGPGAGLLDRAGGKALDRLRRHFEEHRANFVDSNLSRGCLMGNLAAELADHDPQVREALAKAFGSWSSLLRKVLVQAQEDGTLDESVDARELAEFILNAWEGALLKARVVSSEAPLDVFFATVFGRLLGHSDDRILSEH